MGTSSSIVQLCRSMVHTHENSCLQIEANDVVWKIFVRNGQLQYAVHSLQTLDILAHYLMRSGKTLSSSMRESLTSLTASSSWNMGLWCAINQLEQQNIVSSDGAKSLKLALSKDALELLFWLSEAEHSQSSHQLGDSELIAMNVILNELDARLLSWQRLQPVVISPYQQIACPDSARLNYPVANGHLNQALLTMLSQLMQGNSIHQVAGLLKQDSLKVAQLLYPYIQQQIFVVAPPVPPLDRLPFVPANGASPRLQTASANVLKKAPKVVCIDDSPAMLDTLRKYLEADGFDVATVENPMESMSTLFAMKPNMILMDISMPRINGRRLCEILRRSSAFKDLPIIMVSSNTSVLEKAKAESSGATAYLQKPFSKAELLAIVRSYLKTATAV